MSSAAECKEDIPRHEISTWFLKLVVDGYTRSMGRTTATEATLNDFIVAFYPKQEYILLLNSASLRLTLIDTVKDFQLLSSEVIPLNDEGLTQQDREQLGVEKVGICYKPAIKLDNLPDKLVAKLLPNGEYNAIFQFCGDKEEFGRAQNSCILLHSINNTAQDFNKLYYYPLPAFPSATAHYHSCVYSDAYGLIALGRSQFSSMIAVLDMKNEQWNVENMSPETDLFSQGLYDPPALCLIDDKQVFFVNGANNYWYNNKAAIWNLETKTLSVLSEDNYFEAKTCGIFYDEDQNLVLIAGAQGGQEAMKVIRYFNLQNNEFNQFSKRTNNPYNDRPVFWLSKRGSVLNIAGAYPFHDAKKICHEWLDYTGPLKFRNNDNISQITAKIFETENRHNFSVVGCI